MHRAVDDMMQSFSVKPRQDSADFGRHIYREVNTAADELAGRHAHSFEQHWNSRAHRKFRLFFDASSTSDGAGGGWVLYALNDDAPDTPLHWIKIAALSFSLDTEATVTTAELEACLWGVVYFASWLRNPRQAAQQALSWEPHRAQRQKVLELAGLIQ